MKGASPTARGRCMPMARPSWSLKRLADLEMSLRSISFQEFGDCSSSRVEMCNARIFGLPRKGMRVIEYQVRLLCRVTSEHHKPSPQVSCGQVSSPTHTFRA